MSIKTIDEYSPAVVSFIPLLYVAWADGLLSPSEVKIIKRKIRSLPHLTDEERETLLTWSDPGEWPDDMTFKQWMALMKDAGGQLPDHELDSVVALGRKMAEQAKIGDIYPDSMNRTMDAVSTLASELDIPGLVKFRALGRKVKAKKDPSFQVKALQDFLHGANKPVIERIQWLLSDPGFSRRPIRDKERYREQVLQWLKELAKQGYGALGFPEEYGGQGDIISYSSVFEVLSFFDLSLAVKFGVQFGLFGGSIQHLGTAEHHRKYLPLVGSAELLGCFAMTETAHGSNVRDLNTTATYDPDSDEFVIQTPSYEDGKEYIGNALHGQMASVFAQLVVNGRSHGVHAILVPMRSADGTLLPGITVEDNGYKLGLNGVDNGRIWFDQVRVPRENLLNRFGDVDDNGNYTSPIESDGKRFFTMLGTLVAGRICVARGALGAAKSALTIAVRYALKRRQFGPGTDEPETLLMDYPSHQRRLLPKLARAYAVHFVLDHLVESYTSEGSDGRETETLAAGIKAYATWFANDAIQECREACGGKGYLWENRFADLRSDADIFATFEGDNTVLMQLVAKGLLSDFREEFNAGGFMASIRFLASQMSDSFLTINPLYKRKTDSDHLHSPGFHNHAFQFRERKLLHALGNRMRNMFKKRITPYDVFLRTQNHMLALADAYVNRVILEQFQAALSRAEGESFHEPLQKLYTLFALETMESHRGWYLEQDYMEGVKTKAIRRLIDRLCSEIKDYSEELVSGFGIPDGLLGAPIVVDQDRNKEE